MVRDSHLTGGGRWGPIEEAKIDGDMNPTGRDRWGPNRQRQMGTYSQQVETDGDTYSTGRNRRGHDPTDILHVTCTQQVKPGPHQAVTETGAQQQRQVGSRQRQPVSEAQVPRADTRAGKTPRHSESQTLDSEAELWLVLVCLGERMSPANP